MAVGCVGRIEFCSVVCILLKTACSPYTLQQPVNGTNPPCIVCCAKGAKFMIHTAPCGGKRLLWMNTYTHTHTHTHTCTCADTHTVWTNTHAHTHDLDEHTHSLDETYTHRHAHARTHTHTHTHSYSYTHSHCLSPFFQLQIDSSVKIDIKFFCLCFSSSLSII